MPSRPARLVGLAAVLLLLLGGAVGDQTSAAVGDAAQPPSRTRIGTIVRFDAAVMDVRIDEGLLRSAPYLHTFRPVLGERVLVQQYDQTWVVLGAFAGMPPDNPIVNPSFADGTDGSMPSGWTELVGNVDAGTPVMSREPVMPGLQPIDGPNVLSVVLNPSAVTSSDTKALSSPVAVGPGQRWSAAAYVTARTKPSNDPRAFLSIGWYADAITTTPLSTTPTAAVTVPRDFDWRLMTSRGDSGGAAVPAGAAYLRVILDTQFIVAETLDVLTVQWDRVVAWRVS